MCTYISRHLRAYRQAVQLQTRFARTHAYSLLHSQTCNIYVHIYTYTHTHIYIHTYTHTHAHTQITYKNAHRRGAGASDVILVRKKSGEIVCSDFNVHFGREAKLGQPLAGLNVQIWLNDIVLPMTMTVGQDLRWAYLSCVWSCSGG
jgi:phosphatidate phosphatase PAH1